MQDEREDLHKELFSKKEPELEDLKRSLPSRPKAGTETGLNQQQLCQLEPETPERDRVKEEDSTERNSRAVRRLGDQPRCLSHHGLEMQKAGACQGQPASSLFQEAGRKDIQKCSLVIIIFIAGLLPPMHSASEEQTRGKSLLLLQTQWHPFCTAVRECGLWVDASRHSQVEGCERLYRISSTEKGGRV